MNDLTMCRNPNVDPLKYAHKKILLLRKSMPELRELIDKSRELLS